MARKVPVVPYYGCCWVGADGVHRATYGHEQWIVDRFGVEHSRGLEENIEQRYRNYRVAESKGYLRANITRNPGSLEIISSDGVLRWEDLPSSARATVEALAFEHGLEVAFEETVVIERPGAVTSLE